MVNGLTGYNYNPSFAGNTMRVAASSVALNQNDVQNLVKFVNGQPITGSNDISIGQTFVSTVPMLAIFGGISGFSSLKNNGLSGDAAKAFAEQRKNGQVKGWNFSETAKNLKAMHNYQRSQALTAGVDSVKNKFKDVLKKSVVADTNRGFFGRLIDKVPGYKALRQSGFGQLMSNKGTGAGWMAVIDGALETFTQVIPTFQQVGTAAGLKQIAKSGTKVIAGTAGWVAGDVGGRALGAAIGTFICPGIGTAIGSFVGGFLGGCLGSAIAGKVATSITGKSELELHNEKQTQQIAQQVDADVQTKIALAQQALQQAEAILAQDPQNPEALAAKSSAEAILAGIQSEQQSQVVQGNEASTQQPVQSQQISVMQGVPVVPGFDGLSYDMNIYNQYFNKANVMSTPSLTPYQKQNSNNPFLKTAF